MRYIKSEKVKEKDTRYDCIYINRRETFSTEYYYKPVPDSDRLSVQKWGGAIEPTIYEAPSSNNTSNIYSELQVTNISIISIF